MDGICGRCLVIKNATTTIVAKLPDGSERIPGFSPTVMPQLKRWAENVLEAGATIDVDDSRGRFAAISTWHGDPICRYHLYMAVAY